MMRYRHRHRHRHCEYCGYCFGDYNPSSFGEEAIATTDMEEAATPNASPSSSRVVVVGGDTATAAIFVSMALIFE